MKKVKVPQEVLNRVANGEIDMILSGLNDPELSKNPSFMKTVRTFLKENNLVVVAEEEEESVLKLRSKNIVDIPDFTINMN